MTTPPGPEPQPPEQTGTQQTDTLDLFQEAAWRFWVQHKRIPYDSSERALFETVVGQVWQIILAEVRPGPSGGPDRIRLALAVVTLLLGAGIPGLGAIHGQWTTATAAAGAFLLGVVLTAITPWGRK